MNDNIEISHPVTKVVSAWTAVGITSWADAASAATFIASALAALYTLLLLSEWFWKRVWRPLFARFGWFGLEPAEQRRIADKDEQP